ncbi:hypothetical protein [Tepidibacillus fermentans]|uniref:hypothetical protein n=1 Tax=Tepidibacillus fermentans TaxID=1281767 RepID=UPI00104E6A78|nr:hypothetical protein [Tepidibacillus fermentans]
MDKTIYNYKLIRRLRKSPLWLSVYLLFLGSVFTVPFHQLHQPFLPTFILIVNIYFFSYLFWNLLSLWRIRASIQFYFSLLPWFGIVPKRMLSIKEYKQYETMMFFFSSLTFFWMLLFLPEPFYLVNLSLFVLFIGYRFFLFIQIIFILQVKEWIKYEPFGLSVYQTDSF